MTAKLLSALVGTVLLLVGGGVAVWYFAVDRPPRTAVARAADRLGGLAGITYKGTVTEPPFGESKIEITVNKTGNARGTIIRKGGMAEFARVGQDLLIKADRTWWDALDPFTAPRFDGVWLKNPGGQFGAVPELVAAPGALADRLRAQRTWRPESGGPEGRAFRGEGAGKVVLPEDGVPVFKLSHDSSAGAAESRVEITDAAVPALAAIDVLVPGPVPNYWDERQKQARINVDFDQTQGGGNCDAQNCRRNVRVANTGTLTTYVQIKVWLGGAAGPTQWVLAPAGQTVTATVTAPAPRQRAWWSIRYNGS